ncbi:DNA cytosine methyltransferase [Actinomadura rupiterrae]|uniref:DNA cytosine methyltransferase n=1 Tax=Actinomadura rupiterrae TaxID=559627 RepID=UPI0020A3A8FB|nr:DNA cytosine methyltransferase [Actinomadura rupiterrae]MCP2336983.1 DNA (cytosine-5)-methyltransferase 1 [Actinomadura rupiterrae]
MTVTLYDEFAGGGGSTDGAANVPGVDPVQAANHNVVALETHGANFPNVDHILGDVTKTDIVRFARADLFWASPACPPWTDARGKKRDFDKSTFQALPGMPDDPATADAQTLRARKLMEEIPRYLAHWHLRGRPVLAGVVENVVQCRRWAEWHRWLGEIQALGYRTRLIALNSMHVRPVRTARAPQSRDRLYLAYWLDKLPHPDFDKWLRPRAWCPSCDQVIDAIQVFKNPRNDMGRYGVRHGQYVYKCPRHTCRGQVVEPEALPALTAIDWTLPAARIGDRADLGKEPLEAATLTRIRVGIAKYAVPLLTPAGGTWRDTALPVTAPMPTRTTRENDGVAVPPLLVPVEGRPGKTAAPAAAPLRTQTARNETGLAWVPFIVPMRGGGDKERARDIGQPLHTVTAGGNHHGLTLPEPLAPWEHLLVPYNGKGYARPVTGPVGTQPTRDRWSLASGIAADIDLDDVRFRMLEPHEIQRAMAFRDDYIICGTSKRAKVRQLGNAVTPPAAEVIVSALVEAITGHDLERDPQPRTEAA